jgi:uncharacterized protein YecE (DUF72 family)
MSDRAKIYIGTSGWSYPAGEGTWKGHFYPPGRINELEYYSRYFNTVEINSSFYSPPNPGYVDNWAKRVPADFLFTLKLWQKFTHPKMYEESTGRNAAISQEDVDIFKSSIDPLVQSGKLGVLLAQFPPSFKNDDYGRQILGAVINTFGEYKLAVELRHRSWSDDKNTARLLSENHVSWVSIDEPQFSSSVAADVPLTSDMAYFRFHGRNKENWWNGNTETRYKYLYSDRELNELSGKIEAAAGKTKQLFAFFNNHWQAYAPKNAISLMKNLQLPLREVTVQKELLEREDLK